jgi:hypothetical protein
VTFVKCVKGNQQRWTHYLLVPVNFAYLERYLPWIGGDPSLTTTWDNFGSVDEWWFSLFNAHRSRRRAMATLTMLVSCEVWGKCNIRIFRDISSMPTFIIKKIKNEATNWEIAGAKHLSYAML